MASPDDATSATVGLADLDELTDRQVEVLVYRVLAAVIAFLIAAGIAVVLNSDTTDAQDQRVDAMAGSASAVVVVVVDLDGAA